MQSANIYSSSFGFFCVLKVLGLAPYGFDKKRLKFKVTAVNYFQFAASLAVWILLIFLENETKARDVYSVGIQSNLLESLWKQQYTLQHYLATGVVVYSFMKRKHVENFLNLIHRFDQHFEKMLWKVQPKKNNTWFPVIFFLLTTFIMFIYTVIIFTLDEFKDYLNSIQAFQIINYGIVNEFFLMLALQFILSVHCINHRLNVLTEHVRQTLPKNENDEEYRTILGTVEKQKREMKMRNLRNIGFLYDTLVSAVDEINLTFSKQMIAVFMPALILEIFTTYSFIKAFTKRIIIPTVPSIDFLLWNLYLVLPTFVAIYVSAKSTSTSRKLKNLIENSANFCKDEIVFQRVNTLINKLQNQKLIYTTEFFDINWKLLMSIFGTITTYMIIICQFEKDL